MNNDNPTSNVCRHQLVTAIKCRNLTRLRELLNRTDNIGVAITDDDIHHALVQAAGIGCIKSCSIFCEILSERLKNRYAAPMTDDNSYSSPLHLAVRNKHFPVVRLFKKNDFNLNQETKFGRTPLFWSTTDIGMSDYLLENGADPNRGEPYGSLYCAVDYAVKRDSSEIVSLFLDYGADPNHNRKAANEEEDNSHQPGTRNTDVAVRFGNARVLRLLLQHGAFVGDHFENRESTSLNELLSKYNSSRRGYKTKLNIARMLVHHAKVDDDTALFLQITLENTIKNNNDKNDLGCKILLQAGVKTDSRAMHCAVQAKKELECRLLVQYGAVDPFPEETDGDSDNKHDFSAILQAAGNRRTLFTKSLTGGRMQAPILELLLEIWDQRFASNRGKNGSGDFPIHVLCRDRNVSVEAIKTVVERQDDGSLMTVGKDGLRPFDMAIMQNASIGVLFCLLKNFPDALDGLRRLRTTTGEIISSRSAVNDKESRLDAVDHPPVLSASNASISAADGDVSNKGKATNMA